MKKILIKHNNSYKELYSKINQLYLKWGWGLGIGDWGLGIGDWAQSPIPNPHFKYN